MGGDEAVDIEVTATPTDAQLAEIRRLCDDAFGARFGDTDWTNTLGGTHVIATQTAEMVAHAAVVARAMKVGGRDVTVGYVEGVATRPTLQGRGVGSTVMHLVNELIERDYEIGALSTSATAFYERVDWERWRGPTFVRTPSELLRTPDEDDGIMVLRVPTLMVDLGADIVCHERDGDDW